MNHIKTLQQAIQYFSDEQVCIDAVAAMKWPNGKAVCPNCESKEHYYLAARRVWKCKKCAKQFSVKVRTIFEDSPIGLDKWLLAMWMLGNCRNGVSSYEIHRAIGVSQKSAWFMLQRIRLAMRPKRSPKFGGTGSEIEADESFIGGKDSNKHESQRKELRLLRNAGTLKGSGHLVSKTAVMGMLDRDKGKVHAAVVPEISRRELQSAILNHIMPGSKLYTDKAGLYRGLPQGITHDFVNHVTQYVNGRVHTNGIENFWSLLKRGLNGTYVAVEPFHLHRYLDEQVFRFNTRKDGRVKISDSDRFKTLLGQVAGRRLTWAEVTGKEGQATPF
jgi:transposase-like protein